MEFKFEKEVYKPIHVSSFFLVKGLDIMTNFSMSGNVDDWNEGDLLDGEFEDSDVDDWKLGGGLGIG